MGYKPYTLDDCPITPVVNIISGKWTALILWEIYNGHNHYGEIKKSLVGINTRTLSSRLRMLENKGVLNRKVNKTIPPTVEYTLTKMGNDLEPVLYSMKDWSDKYRDILI